MNSTLRRGLYITSKISFIILIFAVYQLSIAPSLEMAFAQKLIGRSGQSEASRGVQLEPILKVNSASSTLYNLNLSDSKLRGTLGGDGIFVTSDPRVIALRQFLIDYNSPMYPYAEVFIKEADRHGLDWRLLVAISGVESAFGNIIPHGSYNAWGWKGDPTRDWSYFSSWSHAIQVITEGLATGYGTTLTPFQIEPTYCPPCGRTPGHPWANGVTRYMDEMEYYVDHI